MLIGAHLKKKNVSTDLCTNKMANWGVQTKKSSCTHLGFYREKNITNVYKTEHLIGFVLRPLFFIVFFFFYSTEKGSKKRSSLSVVFSELGFRMRSPGNLSDEQLNKTLDGLYNRVYMQEKNELVQLQIIFDALTEVASNTYMACSTKETSLETSDKLKTYIREYFKNKISLDVDIKHEVSHIL